MSIDTVITDDSNKGLPVIRSRVDRATACYYPVSKRVVIIADRQDFRAAEEALAELRSYVVAERKVTP